MRSKRFINVRDVRDFKVARAILPALEDRLSVEFWVDTAPDGTLVIRTRLDAITDAQKMYAQGMIAGAEYVIPAES